MSRPVYLDSNAFIDTFETRGQAQRTLTELMRLARERKRVSVVTSRVTMAEVLVRPLRDGDDAVASSYLQTFDSSLIDVREVDAGILFHASLLRADNRRLKLFDAIHIATAHRASAAMIVTRDSDFSDVRPGPACGRFGQDSELPVVCAPDSPAFAAFVERHAP